MDANAVIPRTSPLPSLSHDHPLVAPSHHPPLSLESRGCGRAHAYADLVPPPQYRRYGSLYDNENVRIAVDPAHGTVEMKMSQLYPSKLTKGMLRYGRELIELGVLCENWAVYGTCVCASFASTLASTEN
jgi:hypothetical protein